MATQTATTSQDQVLEAIKVALDASVSAFKTWADACATILPKVPDLWSTPNADYVGFAEKLWSNQRDFNTKVYEAVAPLGKTAFDVARSTAKAAQDVTETTTARATAGAKA